MRFSRLFYASYSSDCNQCGGCIDEGDLVGYVESELMCEPCYTELQDAEDDE
jgi:hypothetical protein